VTLVLTAVAPNFVVQVSDRLVTDAGSGKVLDPVTNKTVIYLARNAHVTIGYSGLAYIEGITTDRWIAQILRDQDLEQPGGRGLMMMGAAPSVFDIAARRNGRCRGARPVGPWYVRSTRAKRASGLSRAAATCASAQASASCCSLITGSRTALQA
jgi:hypothetical protein